MHVGGRAVLKTVNNCWRLKRSNSVTPDCCRDSCVWPEAAAAVAGLARPVPAATLISQAATSPISCCRCLDVCIVACRRRCFVACSCRRARRCSFAVPPLEPHIHGHRRHSDGCARYLQAEPNRGMPLATHAACQPACAAALCMPSVGRWASCCPASIPAHLHARLDDCVIQQELGLDD